MSFGYIVLLTLCDYMLIQDIENGYFMNANDQVTLACSQIRSDTKLAYGYNAIGFSQGGQFLCVLLFVS